MYKLWIKSGSNYDITGILYQSKDSSILLANPATKKSLLSGNYYIKEIKYYDINMIQTRNINGIGNGALYGSLLGLLAGVIVGYSLGDDPQGIISFSAGEKAIIGGIFGVLSGSIVGVAVGSARITIPINSKIENFNKNKDRLDSHSFMH